MDRTTDDRAPGRAYQERMIAVGEGLDGCARCGGVHERLAWKAFERPAPSDGGVYTAWAPCPTSGDPILFEIRTASEGDS